MVGSPSFLCHTSTSREGIPRRRLPPTALDMTQMSPRYAVDERRQAYAVWVAMGDAPYHGRRVCGMLRPLLVFVCLYILRGEGVSFSAGVRVWMKPHWFTCRKSTRLLCKMRGVSSSERSRVVAARRVQPPSSGEESEVSFSDDGLVWFT